MRCVDNSSHSTSSLGNYKSRWPKPMNVEALSKWPSVRLSDHGEQLLQSKTSGPRHVLSGLPNLAPFRRGDHRDSTLLSSHLRGLSCKTLPFTKIVDGTCPSDSGTQYAGDSYRTRTTLSGSRANPSTHHSTSPMCLCFCNSTTGTSKTFGQCWPCRFFPKVRSASADRC